MRCYKALVRSFDLNKALLATSLILYDFVFGNHSVLKIYRPYF